MRMLRWMLGITLKDRKRNYDICHAIGVCCITDKIRESRLRWYGHVQRWEDDHCVKRILEAELYGSQNRGRQRKRWINIISQDLISMNLTPVDVEDRDDWRRRTRHLRHTQWPEGESEIVSKVQQRLYIVRCRQRCQFLAIKWKSAFCCWLRWAT